MSHTTTVETIIFTDIEALRAAIADLNQQGVRCELREQAVPRGYYQEQAGLEQAPYVIYLPDSRYDVGLYPRRNGQPGYVPRADFFSGQIACQLGVTPQGTDQAAQEQAALGKLNQAYAIQASFQQALRQGYQVYRVDQEDGTVQLRVSVH